MKIIRSGVNALYNNFRPLIFGRTEADPEVAHEWMISAMRFLYHTRLDRLVLKEISDQELVKLPRFPLSNAAGFNKNGEIPPQTLNHLGFTRVVIGTVTAQPWEGNPRPRMRRFSETESLVNWMGLPGDGAEVVAERLESYRSHQVPLTINLMATPGKFGDAALRDLETTVRVTRDLGNVGRYELNISCPNTHGSDGSMDARKDYSTQTDDMIGTVYNLLRPGQELDVKVSPDNTEDDVRVTVSTFRNRVSRVTAANTTSHHNPRYINESPGKGGASGAAVGVPASDVRRMFKRVGEEMGESYKLIACGGIDNMEIGQMLVSDPTVVEMQIFTPLIYKGPGIFEVLDFVDPESVRDRRSEELMTH